MYAVKLLKLWRLGRILVGKKTGGAFFLFRVFSSQAKLRYKKKKKKLQKAREARRRERERERERQKRKNK